MDKLTFSRFGKLDYACTEALNTLCANLSFIGSGINKIMITSSKSSEGKTFLAVNMMRTLANLGKNVVLVDTDLRRSIIASRYGLRAPSRNMRGLAHYLAGMCDLEDVLYATDMQGAYFVPIGREVSNSLSLLSTPRLPQLLDWLARRYDVVLVDAPPVGIIIDAAEIAKFCDGTIMVASYGKISRRELHESKLQIERTGCRVLGAVLNNVVFDTYSSRKYYYGKYYTSDYSTRRNRSGQKPPPRKRPPEGDRPVKKKAP